MSESDARGGATLDSGGPLSQGVAIRRGLAWSTLNNVSLRAASLVLGVLLARLLAPEDFGVYAVALTVQSVLMTLVDLGLGADLIRAKDPARRAPTVATLGLLAGTAFALVMFVLAHPLASLLGSPESSSVIAALSVTLVLAGAGVVPYAQLNRHFQQKRLFAISLTDFLLSSLVTVVLVLLGWGPLALAAGRLVGQTATVCLQFGLAGVRPRFGLDQTLVKPVLGFGLPLAAANLLSWALLGADKVVVAHTAGPVLLGYYVLAFNVSTWPMSAIGQVVRSIALPAYATLDDSAKASRSFADGTALSWAVALPAGALLATLSTPLVAALYGDRWLSAVPALIALGLFGSLRVIFDLFAAFLIARGHPRPVLVIQALWILSLVPILLVLTRRYGMVGAGYAHLVTAVAVVLPAYAIAVHRTGTHVRPMLATLVPPLLAAAPCCLVALLAASLVDHVWWQLLLGGCAGAATYAALLRRWLLLRLRSVEGLTLSASSPDVERVGR